MQTDEQIRTEMNEMLKNKIEDAIYQTAKHWIGRGTTWNSPIIIEFLAENGYSAEIFQNLYTLEMLNNAYRSLDDAHTSMQRAYTHGRWQEAVAAILKDLKNLTYGSGESNKNNLMWLRKTISELLEKEHGENR